MKRIMQFSALAAVLASTAGCAGFQATNPDGSVFTDKGSDLGSYKYSVAPDGTVTVDSHTLRGGPDIKVTTKEGATIEVHSSNKQILGQVLKAIAP